MSAKKKQSAKARREARQKRLRLIRAKPAQARFHCLACGWDGTLTFSEKEIAKLPDYDVRRWPDAGGRCPECNEPMLIEHSVFEETSPVVSGTIPVGTTQTGQRPVQPRTENPKCATPGCGEEVSVGRVWCEAHMPPVGLTGGETPEPDTQADITRVCDGIKALLLKKNAAYGDSALKPLRVFSRATPVEQIMVRLDDKLSRLARGHALPDESLDDTLDDILGYLVLLKIAKERQPKLPFGG